VGARRTRWTSSRAGTSGEKNHIKRRILFQKKETGLNGLKTSALLEKRKSSMKLWKGGDEVHKKRKCAESLADVHSKGDVGRTREAGRACRQVNTFVGGVSQGRFTSKKRSPEGALVEKSGEREIRGRTGERGGRTLTEKNSRRKVSGKKTVCRPPRQSYWGSGGGSEKKIRIRRLKSEGRYSSPFGYLSPWGGSGR